MIADFIVEYTGLVEEIDLSAKPKCVLHVDGSSTCRGSGAGLVLESPHGTKTLYAFKFCLKTSNNEAEYEALIAILKLAKNIGVEQFRALSNSMLVIQ